MISPNNSRILSFYSNLANFNIQGNEVADSISEPVGTESPSKNKSKNKMPTPGGPLTEERIKELGVIKMNDYLSSGTRPQFWEEYFVKVIMHVSRLRKKLEFGTCHYKVYSTNHLVIRMF